MAWSGDSVPFSTEKTHKCSNVKIKSFQGNVPYFKHLNFLILEWNILFEFFLINVLFLNIFYKI